MSAKDQDIRLASAEDTRAAGRAVGAALLQMDSIDPLVIALSGDLGAGKTTFVGGLMAALGFVGAVRSPTYTLIEPYALAGRDLYHLDLYRLNDPGELEELGLRDLLRPQAVLLVEWPERAAGGLPKPDLRVQLNYSESGLEGRVLRLIADSESGKKLIHSADFSAVGQ